MLNNPSVKGDFRPADHGLVAWTYDPATVSSQVIMPANGQLITARINLAVPTLVTAIQLMLQAAGVSLTSGQNFAMLFDETGARVGVTADQSPAWVGATGTKDMALTAPVQLNGAFCTVGLYANGSTLPTWRLSAPSPVPGNANLSVAASRFGYAANTGLTTTPPTTLGTITQAGPAWWAGLR